MKMYRETEVLWVADFEYPVTLCTQIQFQNLYFKDEIWIFGAWLQSDEGSAGIVEIAYSKPLLF